MRVRLYREGHAERNRREGLLRWLREEYLLVERLLQREEAR